MAERNLCKLWAICVACCGLQLGVVLAQETAAPPAGTAEAAKQLAEAQELSLTARTLPDFEKIIKLGQAAAASQLPEGDRKFAEKLVRTAQLRRAAAHVAALQGIAGNKEMLEDQLPRLRINALADLEEIVSVDPTNAEAHWVIAQLHAMPDGDTARAMEALEALIKLNDDNPQEHARVLLARHLLQPKDKQEADLNAAVKIAPEMAAAYRARAAWRLQNDRTPDALADMKEAIKLEPRNLRSQELYALLLAQNDKLDEALESINKALEALPEVPSLYLTRVQLLMQAKRYPEALTASEEVIRLRPDNPLSYLMRAEINIQDKKYEAALPDIDKALEKAPGLERAILLQAEVLSQLKKYDEAIALLEPIAESATELGDVHGRLIVLYTLKKDHTRALELTNKLLKQLPENAGLIRMRADLYIDQGEHESAVTDYTRAIELNPKDSSSMNNLAWLLSTSPSEKLRDGKRAITLATKACELTDFKQASFLSTLASSYAETGDFKSAMKYIDQAVEHAKDDDTKDHLKKERASYEEEKPWREAKPERD